MDIEKIKKSIQLRDRCVRVLSKNGHFRVSCVKNTKTAQTAQLNHSLDDVSAVILAKSLSGASLAASFLKGEERVVLDFDGTGPIKKVYAEALQIGEVRGFVDFKDSTSEITDFNTPLGEGVLRVSRILYNRAEPITGIVELHKGDIATDLAFYYNQSEQVPTAVILDSIVDDNGLILESGGLILQALPGHKDIEILEIFSVLSNLPRLTELLSDGLNPQKILKKILPFEFDLINSTQVDFFCRCSKDSFTSRILTLGLNNIIEMQNANQNELVCHYCNKHYYFDDNDFASIKEQLIAKNN
ncbi:Hsp33 family molecular chaperone HslO [Candidatus Kapaibacterium sp.]